MNVKCSKNTGNKVNEKFRGVQVDEHGMTLTIREGHVSLSFYRIFESTEEYQLTV